MRRVMTYATNCIIIHLLQLCWLPFSWTIDSKRDFYDYTKATVLGKQNIKLKSTVPYPHWSDSDNLEIDIVSSGIARFSGFSGINTLDVLIYATKFPITNDQVRYEQIENPKALLKDELRQHLGDLATSNFSAKHVTIITWTNVPFMPTRFSTFQMIFSTDGNTSYAILLIDNINHDVNLLYFPEIDLRYSYEGGTKFQRLDFLKKHSGVSTRTEAAANAAAENSNCKKAGRWCFRLTDTPIPPVTTKPPDTTQTTVKPPAGSSVKQSSGIGLKGAFTFTSVALEGNSITDGKNNDEVSIILTKKSADQRYDLLNKNMKAYIEKLYGSAADANATVEILGYRLGSLIVEYSVNAKSTTVCNGTSGQDCLNEVKKKVEDKVKNNTDIKSGALSAKIDPKKIEVTDFDECSTGTNCDFNAICIDYPNQFTFGCFCKVDFVGDGFPGNCKPKYASFHFTSIVMYITIIVVLLSVAFITVVFYKVYKNDKEEEELLEEYNSRKMSTLMGWHSRNPYAYRHDNNVYQRRFPVG